MAVARVSSLSQRARTARAAASMGPSRRGLHSRGVQHDARDLLRRPRVGSQAASAREALACLETAEDLGALPAAAPGGRPILEAKARRACGAQLRKIEQRAIRFLPATTRAARYRRRRERRAPRRVPGIATRELSRRSLARSERSRVCARCWRRRRRVGGFTHEWQVVERAGHDREHAVDRARKAHLRAE
jgi:hypothetical protein